MALDGVLLNSIITELQTEILGGRIEKIYQPEKDEIHVIVRNRGKNYRLLLSASTSHPRLHLTETPKSNPEVPPMFCMLLRKHLSGGKIVNIVQPGFERIAEIYVESMDELGDITVKRLIIEIMGRHSNIILVNADGVIIDSIKHITGDISRIREVLPGRKYVYPPSHGKKNPLEEGSNSLEEYLKNLSTGKKLENILTDMFTGISRVTASEIVFRAIGDREAGKLSSEEISAISSSFIDFFKKVKNREFFTTVLIDNSGYPRDILPFRYLQYSPEYLKEFTSVSRAMDYFYAERDKQQRMQQRTAHLLRVIKTNLERCQKKLAIQKEELLQAEEAKKYRLWGELIIANIYRIPKGVKEVKLVNYHDPLGSTITIPLDEHKTAAQNAEQYFKKYSKAKNALKILSKQIEESKQEIDYLEGLLDSIEKCTEYAEIEEIKEELARQGYIKTTPVTRRKKTAHEPSKPHHFISSDGFDIFVGKNNTQNDRLTLKMASSEDIWLHTKNIPGSHVIIKTGGRKIPERTLLEAAILAAYFSKGRQSSNVPVDWCPRKNVKKPGGAKPGMVIYENYNTVYVTPSSEIIDKLKKI